jgi:hypothetical protein
LVPPLSDLVFVDSAPQRFGAHVRRFAAAASILVLVDGIIAIYDSWRLGVFQARMLVTQPLLVLMYVSLIWAAVELSAKVFGIVNSANRLLKLRARQAANAGDNEQEPDDDDLAFRELGPHERP